jgi:hypothetical protein
MKNTETARPSKEMAEALAAKALEWLVQDHARLQGFMGATGLSPADLRARIHEPETLVAVMGFILSEDGMVLECCAALGVPPHQAAMIRDALPGGGEVHWT